MNRQMEHNLREGLVTLAGSDFASAEFRPSGTGCINETWEARGSGQSLFLKLGPVSAQSMYRQEWLGLEELRRCEAIRVPAVVGVLQLEMAAVLVLEFIPLHSPRPDNDVNVGNALAALHGIEGKPFGLSYDNYIGRTPQINTPHADWWQFWCDCRMVPQWRLAALKGMRRQLLDKLETLIERIPAAFGDHQPEPVLLHGDLWSGNLAVDSTGKPVLFDPAVYYGDRETDIAMSKMFGAMRPAVYSTYHARHPVLPGAERRRQLYDLYHWLNHFNLFGVTYLGQVENTVDDLLSGAN